MKELDTGVRFVSNVKNFVFGAGSIQSLAHIIRINSKSADRPIIYLIDSFFASRVDLLPLQPTAIDQTIYINTADEPTTELVDTLTRSVLAKSAGVAPSVVVGIGGGAVMDIAKAISNLITNGGCAADYQGWDLVKKPGIFKIGVPTISGTGSEATRTCVMTNKATGLKLGMNSDHSVFDYVIMDPNITETVPRNQYFYTGMDAYIHCMESISGNYRNPIGDANSNQALSLCEDVFLSKDMKDPSNREKLMVASYLGGCAIATSYVGLVHPLSAALSVVFGLHHCVSNCIVMRAMSDYYPEYYDRFWLMAERQSVEVPRLDLNLSDEVLHEKLFNATLMHRKPLINALGEGFESVLKKEVVTSLFARM